MCQHAYYHPIYSVRNENKLPIMYSVGTTLRQDTCLNTSVVNPKLFFLDPDPAATFNSTGSGSRFESGPF